MKLIVSSRTFLAMAVLISICTLNMANAQDQTAPPAASDATTLPPGITPGSQTAEVVKLAQAGLDASVINAYVVNAASAFNLDADQIITLKDVGVPTTVINTMMDHDKNLAVAATTMPAPVQDAAPAPAPDTTTAPPQVVDTAPDATDATPDTTPPPPVTVDYFNQNLNPYGSWIVVNGYGRCWRPTTVIYDPNWRPYCDRGHWVYTDCGWYWDSDYSWGVTFHYGRWFRDTRFGWCWYPDTEWAPSWVTWRSSDDYCGWAPLPPFAVFRPGAGFFYRGVVVGVDFDFGLGADYFTFIAPDRFCDPHPRNFCVDSRRRPDVFRRTTVINHFDAHDRFVANAGIPVERFGGHGHPAITPVAVGSLPTARREGWRGNVVVPQHMGPGNPRHNGSPSFNHGNANNGNGQVQGGFGSHDNHNGGLHPSNNNNNNTAGAHPAGAVYNSNSGNNQGGHFANQTTGNSHNPPTGGQPANTTTGNNAVGTTQSNNRNWNNGAPANGHDFHAPNQNGGNSSAHYSSPSSQPGTPVTGGNNSAGVTHVNNQAWNGNGANNHDNHVQSQGPTTGNSSARYTSPAAPAPNLNGSPAVNNNRNANGYSGGGVMNQRAEQQWPRPQNNYQPPSYNNSAAVPQHVAPQPRAESAPAVAPQPEQRSGGAAYSTHNNGGSASGNSGSSQGNQSRNSNNNQQNH